MSKLEQLRLLPADSFYVIKNGRIVDQPLANLTENDNFHVCLRILGGKGGFGSLLRSFGSQFYKSTNQDMCRDLSGRRLKDIKDEEKLQKYVAGIAKRNEDKKRKLDEKYEKLKQNVEPKQEKFSDEEFLRKKQNIAEETEKAVIEGMKAATSKASTNQDCESNTDSDEYDQPGPSHVVSKEDKSQPANPTKKRKLQATDLPNKETVGAKKPKRDAWLGVEYNSEDDEENEEEQDEPKTAEIP